MRSRVALLCHERNAVVENHTWRFDRSITCRLACKQYLLLTRDDEKAPGDYGVDVKPRLEVLKTVEPGGRKAGVKVKTVGELVQKLKTEAGVI